MPPLIYIHIYVNQGEWHSTEQIGSFFLVNDWISPRWISTFSIHRIHLVFSYSVINSDAVECSGSSHRPCKRPVNGMCSSVFHMNTVRAARLSQVDSSTFSRCIEKWNLLICRHITQVRATFVLSGASHLLCPDGFTHSRLMNHRLSLSSRDSP